MNSTSSPSKFLDMNLSLYTNVHFSVKLQSDYNIVSTSLDRHLSNNNPPIILARILRMDILEDK